MFSIPFQIVLPITFDLLSNRSIASPLLKMLPHIAKTATKIVTSSQKLPSARNTIKLPKVATHCCNCQKLLQKLPKIYYCFPLIFHLLSHRSLVPFQSLYHRFPIAFQSLYHPFPIAYHRFPIAFQSLYHLAFQSLYHLAFQSLYYLASNSFITFSGALLVVFSAFDCALSISH